MEITACPTQYDIDDNTYAVTVEYIIPELDGVAESIQLQF